MADESDKAVIGEATAPTPPAEAPVETPVEDTTAAPEEDADLKAKAEQKANLDKAILDAQDTLRGLRKEIKEVKTAAPKEEEELPKINLEDPSSKVWDNRIKETVAPVAQELEQEKEEVLQFSLREFLKDKPALAKNPEKLKAVMTTYSRIKSSSGRTREGVMLDLDKAYAAEHHEELITAARNGRIEGAEKNAFLSDIAVSRGSTTYQPPKENATIKLSKEEEAQLAKWGMTPAEYIEMKKKHG